MMFAALHIPDFEISAALRKLPERHAEPAAVLAVATGHAKEEKLPLLSINAAARLAGIMAGWPLNRALVRCPGLRVFGRDPDEETALLHELVVLAESLTPDVELTAADLVLLDLSHRSTPFLSDLQSLEISGVKMYHGIAATPDLAGLAARHKATRNRSISPADLQQLPIDLLATLSAKVDTLSLLQLWGLKTIGEFTGLPRQALIERLGPEAGEWHDVLLGKTCRLLRLHRAPENLEQSYSFEDPVVSVEPVIFALRNLLHTLSGRLAARHLAVCCVHLRLILEYGETLPRQIRLPEPQTAAEKILTPLVTLIDSLQLHSAISGIELGVETTFATSSQKEWYGRQLAQPERWPETLAKLEALLGSGRVGIPIPGDSHMPDSFSLHPATNSHSVPVKTSNPVCPLPLSRFRPPLQISVAHETRGNQPWPLALLNGPHAGRIAARRGPFAVSGNWWNPEAAWQQLEWDVEMESHHIFRLVYQKPENWQLEGIYR